MRFPPPRGLYDPSFEHDACGLGFVATLTRAPERRVVTGALEVLRNLTHRGAAGRDPLTGDGAGIAIELPHALFADERPGLAPLPAAGDYAVAMCFLPTDPAARAACENELEAAAVAYGQRVIGWRDVPTEPGALGPLARGTCPVVRQLFLARGGPPDRFERSLYLLRRRASKAAPDLYVASCSSRTLVYKGLMLAEQLAAFYPDLSDDRVVSRLGVVHSRFSTNTFPRWDLAHPFRVLAHNGEINTLRGNRARMEARAARVTEGGVWSEGEAADLLPVLGAGGSDSAALDEMVEFLLASGRPLGHVMMMVVPEAYEHDASVDASARAFYDYHGRLLDPWDGPAALCFTDGHRVGARLDRNGLRPAKYVVSDEGLVILASEFGVLPVAPERVLEKGRLRPGTMLLVDLDEGRLVHDDEARREAAGAAPWGAWVGERRLTLDDLPAAEPPAAPAGEAGARLRAAFGYTHEDVNVLLAPTARTGEEPLGSMGADIPLAVLSDKPQSLFRYFKQHFAQVTNPPIDPVREEVVTSLVVHLGDEGQLVGPGNALGRTLTLAHPVLTDDDVARLRAAPEASVGTRTLDATFAGGEEPGRALREALARLGREACEAVEAGALLVIIGDRAVGPGRVAVPSLLALGAVQRGLYEQGARAGVSLVVESGEVREVAHLALLLGYGAGAVNPYLAFATVAELCTEGGALEGVDPTVARERVAKAMKKGLLKVMSKMGIATLAGYRAAQLFEVIGLDRDVVDAYFGGTASRVRGVGLDEIARDAAAHHAAAFAGTDAPRLGVGGHYQFRREGENHLWTPASVAALQKAARLNDASTYAEYARLINEQGDRPVTLRSLWTLKPAGAPVPLDEVEPAVEIVKRFATGAMSFGSISKEAHENLALAMNRIGGRSNSGEGGEDPLRYRPGGEVGRRSAIKQVASARFGVTTEYLVNADELQIKIAQGAKPGEGGQLPGHKVDAVIARVRHSTPGVTLVSPPPHHDIYSIEDLAQLIFDLKNVNPAARVSVKLVAEAGVGTVAAGVAKARADVILISGHDGGTGASPLSSVHHAGVPWEMGLAEAQQVLVMNGLRGRVRLQVDGQIKTGRDVIFGALLGAEEFGFATAPLVASGCVMMRKCHLNTCPVGIATQDPELRRRFVGTPENVINYLFFVAEEARALLAELGFSSIDEAVGRVDCVVPRTGVPLRAARLDFSEVLTVPAGPEGGPIELRAVTGQDHHLDDVADRWLIEAARPALERGVRLRLRRELHNDDRAFGAMLSGEIARRHGDTGLADDTIFVEARGHAGQSFGAFAARGVTLRLEGDANDYVGKGLSGGVLAVFPPREARFAPEAQVIAGNTLLYGATGGEAYFNGRVGERFAVRNSGALAVVEGVGDHACEYMTGGVVVVLGPVGRNFGAGMSGGVAIAYDEAGAFAALCHPDSRAAIEPLAPGDDALVRELLARHLGRTGSPLAERLLAAWGAVRTRFVKVVPREFRASLAARPELERSADLSPAAIFAREDLSPSPWRAAGE